MTPTTNYPIPLAKLEKKFGPYIPGKGKPTHTISAIQQVTSGKARGTYLGVVGIVPGAEFHIQFPSPVSLNEFNISTRGIKHPADSVKDLASDGPQGGQNRRAEFDAWLLVQSWQAELQTLTGTVEAELRIPRLNRTFHATLAITGRAGQKKVGIKGPLRPVG